MNTAIEADDTHAELRDRARASMTLWHRLIGRIVKDGVAAGTVEPEHRSVRARVDPHERARRRADALPPVRRPDAHGPTSSRTSSTHVETLRVRPEGDHRMTALDPTFRRRRALAHGQLDRPRTRALQPPRPRRLRAARARSQRGAAAPPPAAALLGMQLDDGRARPHRVLASSPTRCTRTRWARCTAASSRRSSTARWVARCSRCSRPATGIHDARTEDELRAADRADDGRRARRRSRRAPRRTVSRRPKRRVTTKPARCTRTRRRRA